MPRRKSTSAELEKRGSRWVEDRRREEAKAAKSKPRWEPPSPPRRPLPRTRDDWRRLCSSLPGYDPWAGAGRYRFWRGRAARAIRWIETHCRHIKGELAGQYLRLEDWQRAVVANLFGWADPETRLRRYRRCLVYVPRKNAKTTLAAAIACYVFFCDGEPGAELYAAAAKMEQSRILWRLARSMIAREPSLDARCVRYMASILLDDEESFFQPLASEGKSEHGRSTQFAVIDEVHAQANADIMEALGTSTGGRRQPLILLLTTADVVGETVCNEELRYAKQVRDNAGHADRPGADPTYLPVIYEATVEDDWTSEDVWRRVNPLWDASPTIRSTLRAECRKAKDQPSYVNAFRRWYLNVQTETSVAWLPMAEWDDCGEPFDPEALRGARCFAGLDLSSTTDMTAFVLYFPEGHHVLPWFWVPAETAKRRDRGNDPAYLRWGEAGALTLTEGNVIDYELVLDRVEDAARTYTIAEIGIDPWNSRQISIELEKRGHKMVEVRQGPFTLNEPSKRLEALVRDRKLRHGGHPVLRWNAVNCRVKLDDKGNICPVKGKGAEKIDGLAALVTAMAVAGVQREVASVDALYASEAV